jgi:hypothetical protein
MTKETLWYIGGNTEHLGKQKRYITNTRELLRLLHEHKIHVFYHTNLVEWLGEDPLLAGEGRLKVLIDKGVVHSSNEGLYYLK